MPEEEGALNDGTRVLLVANNRTQEGRRLNNQAMCSCQGEAECVWMSLGLLCLLTGAVWGVRWCHSRKLKGRRVLPELSGVQSLQ